MGFVDVFLEHILRCIIYSFKSVVHSVTAAGTGEWPCAEATVTAQPMISQGFGCATVEVVYSYRFDAELYTGIHEEPFLLDHSPADYVARFSKGRMFVVRVKPSDPEVSAVREGDQVMELARPEF